MSWKPDSARLFFFVFVLAVAHRDKEGAFGKINQSMSKKMSMLFHVSPLVFIGRWARIGNEMNHPKEKGIILMTVI